MYRILHILLALLLFFGFSQVADAQLDTAAQNALSTKLQEYFEALKHEEYEVQKEECDFLIESTKDSLLRQYVALTVYEHFRDSKIMGAEAVAIHVLDRWIFTGEVKMRNDMELLAAKVFAEFNRHSLVGMQAPPLEAFAPDGSLTSLFTSEDRGGRYRVIYFYDTDCATCKVQTILLRNLLQEEDFPLDFYAFYAADNEAEWDAYVAEQLTFDTRRTRVFHLWDPELDSDFQRMWGVIQTPRIFLVSPDGTIVGRGLDAGALSLMLHRIFDEVQLQYGSDASAELYDGVFGESDNVPVDEVKSLVDYVAETTLQKKDTVMCRQMLGDLLYYLPLRRGEGFKEGLDYLVDNYVLVRADLWRSEDDSLKVVEYAAMMDDMLSKTTPGKRVPALVLPGELLSSRRVKTGEFNIRRLGGKRNIVFFYTDGCAVCAAEKEAALALVAADRKARVLQVNVDEIVASDPDLASKIFESFDLSALPFLIEIDKKGRIYRRYISLIL